VYPQCLHRFTFLPAVHEGSSSSTSLPALIIFWLLVCFYSSPPKGCAGEKRFFENQATLDDFRDGEEGENQALSGFVLRPPCSVIHRDLRQLPRLSGFVLRPPCSVIHGDLRQLPRLSLFLTGTVGRKTHVLKVVREATPWMRAEGPPCPASVMRPPGAWSQGGTGCCPQECSGLSWRFSPTGLRPGKLEPITRWGPRLHPEREMTVHWKDVWEGSQPPGTLS